MGDREDRGDQRVEHRHGRALCPGIGIRRTGDDVGPRPRGGDADRVVVTRRYHGRHGRHDRRRGGLHDALRVVPCVAGARSGGKGMWGSDQGLA